MITPEQVGRHITTEQRLESIRPRGSASTIVGRMAVTRTVQLATGEHQIICTAYFIKKIRNVPPYVSKNIVPRDHYLAMTELARSAGFLVPYAIPYEQNRVQVIDVSQGGQFFDKTMWARLDPNCPEDHFTLDPHHPVFDAFLAIPDATLKLGIDDYLLHARDHNLMIPSDDPANLLVLPDGSWTIWMLDPERLRQYDPLTKRYVASRECYEDDRLQGKSPNEFNERSIRKFFLYIEIIRKELIRLRSY